MPEIGGSWVQGHPGPDREKLSKEEKRKEIGEKRNGYCIEWIKHEQCLESIFVAKHWIFWPKIWCNCIECMAVVDRGHVPRRERVEIKSKYASICHRRIIKKTPKTEKQSILLVGVGLNFKSSSRELAQWIKVTATQAWQPEFEPRNVHGWRRELTPHSYSLTRTNALWHTCAHTRTHCRHIYPI